MSDTPARLHAKNVNILVSSGSEDSDRTIQEMVDQIRVALQGVVRNVTVMSNHYIIDGRVCAVEDYDPETKDRKPGTFPPPWAGGPTDAEVRKMNEGERAMVSQGVEAHEPADAVTAPEFVMPERNQVERTANGRKVRADKGKSRGRRATPTRMKMTEVQNAAGNLADAMRDSQ